MLLVVLAVLDVDDVVLTVLDVLMVLTVLDVDDVVLTVLDVLAVLELEDVVLIVLVVEVDVCPTAGTLSNDILVT